MTIFRYVPVDALALLGLLGLLLAVVAATPALRRRDTARAALVATRVLLAGAVLSVLAVTLMRDGGDAGVNLVPGSGIRSALDNVNRDLGVLNLVGNVAMFVPVGLLLVLATGRRFGAAASACAALSAAVEVLQLALGRSLDVDDVLLNTVGGAVGAAAGVAVLRLLRSRAGSRRDRSTTGGRAPTPG